MSKHQPWLSTAARPFFAVLLFLQITNASAQGERAIIAQCYARGAINAAQMKQCTSWFVPNGLLVSREEFHSCISGGPCFSETSLSGPFSRPSNPVPWGPFPTPISPGQWVRIPTPSVIIPKGAPNQALFGAIDQPTLQVMLPNEAAMGVVDSALSIALPPIADVGQLRQCAVDTENKVDFTACVVGNALPKQYQITAGCLSAVASGEVTPDDAALALLCSGNKSQLISDYDRFMKVRDCVTDSDGQITSESIGGCITQRAMPSSDRYYVGCLINNPDQLGIAATCALSKHLTPEEQIALSCAIETGGEPHAYLTCAGGQILAREIDKCFEGGAMREGGCFGPNSEYQRFVHSVDWQVANVLGGNSAAFKAYKFWRENMVAPDQNSIAVRQFNIALSNLQSGPGPNNEFARAAKGLNGTVTSVAHAIGLKKW